MDKHLYIFFIIFIISNSLYSQQKNIYSFVPTGYDTLGVAKGDLNNDKIDDYVLALYHKNEKKEDRSVDSFPPRLLIILFGAKNGYIQSVISSTALLCKGCGGIFGDPFAGIEIKNNVLQIDHYGNWYLIGQTMNSYWNVKHCDKLDDFAGTNNEDINFITGDYEIKKISENCKLLVNKKGKRKILPLVMLNKFSIEQ